MPLYEYECRACGHAFEFLVRPASPAPACPACHGEDLERLLSGFAVSSEAMREASIQSARRRAGQSRDQRDRMHAQAEDTMEHLKEDYGVEPVKTKPTP